MQRKTKVDLLWFYQIRMIWHQKIKKIYICVQHGQDVFEFEIITRRKGATPNDSTQTKKLKRDETFSQYCSNFEQQITKKKRQKLQPDTIESQIFTLHQSLSTDNDQPLSQTPYNVDKQKNMSGMLGIVSLCEMGHDEISEYMKSAGVRRDVGECITVESTLRQRQQQHSIEQFSPDIYDVSTTEILYPRRGKQSSKPAPISPAAPLLSSYDLLFPSKKVNPSCFCYGSYDEYGKMIYSTLK